MAAGNLERILIIDDDADIQALVKLSLEKVGGFVVHTCLSGEEALRKAPGIKPDLILIDVMMPRLDGPTTLRELRKIPETADTPVIFLTAKSMAREFAQFAGSGVIGRILKPFDPMALPATLRDMWEKRRS